MAARETVDDPVALGSQALADALEQQAATAAILRIISRSPADAQPVFEAIVNAGVRLFKGAAVAISRHHEGQVHPMAIAEDDPERAARWRKVFPFPLKREYIHGAAILDCRVVDVPDVLVTGGQFEAGKRNLAPSGYRAMTVVPLVRDGAAIGAIAVVRMQPGALSAKQIALLETFADQAVIAIENVRLFNEREARNRELAEALEQQTATSEILRVISMSPTDVQPVFDTIVTHAARLCSGQFAFVMLHDRGRLVLAAHTPCSDEFAAYLGRGYPLDTGTTTGRAALAREPVQVLDFLAEPGMSVTSAHRSEGVRTVLAVPMLRGDRLVGVIAVWRHEVRAFSPEQVALLKTFADQAVIAIENVRLFHEIEDKSRELEIASRHKSAFLANMSHELRTPMNAILGFTRIVLRETRERIDRKQAENLEKILASARHLVGLINATLDLTRIEAGRIEITAGEVALAPLLDECLRSVEPLLADGVTLDRHIAPDLPSMRADAEKLRQIVINLLSNAVKFTERGRIDVRAGCRGDRVEVEVADSGIGIPAGKLEAIFEEFEQVDASHTRAHGGTGLGLAIARRLARAMGGELSAHSALGAGSTFRLDLPLQHRDHDEA